MKSIAILTHIDFWRGDGGHKSRITSLAQYLGNHSNLVVVYAGSAKPGDKTLVERKRFSFRTIFLSTHAQLNKADYVRRFRQFVQETHVDVCIIEYLQLAFVIDFLPRHIKFILDTHDLMSDRARSFKSFGCEHDTVSWADELAIFKKFDGVMLIQDKEYQKVRDALGPDKTILVPHGVDFPRQTVRRNVQNVGFIGNYYTPNEVGLRWFLKEVWPRVRKGGIQLNIYGKIWQAFAGLDIEKVRFHGFVPNLQRIFSEIDIMINPVQMGAGLKIKNVEAMANGLPLITTTHSATGLMRAKGKGFLIADDAKNFAFTLNRLIVDFDHRSRLGRFAHCFIQDYFSQEACFKELLQFIYSKDVVLSNN